MVGSVVDKGLMAKGISLQKWNQTLEVGGNTTSEIMDNSIEVMQARIALAMGVTFGAGCVQVRIALYLNPSMEWHFGNFFKMFMQYSICL